MKITKFLHSCLVVEDQNMTFLFDPGIFTYNAQALDLGKIAKLDYLLITHEHADHFHMPLIHAIVAKFPQVKIITNKSIVSLLQKENIVASSQKDQFVQTENSSHEKLWDLKPPENVVIHILNRLTHVGDSLHFSKTHEILILPITAPWGSTTEAVNKALSIKPKVIIPVHDWMWKDEIRKAMYQRLSEFFPTYGIQFKGLETGEPLTI
jgi:L-ascorbate metabolism protein UlaG (beta-lactamase superfamily)